MKCFYHDYQLTDQDETSFVFTCRKCLDMKIKGRRDASPEARKLRRRPVELLDDITPSEEEDMNQPSFIKKVVKQITG